MLRKVNEPKREAVARVAYELYLRDCSHSVSSISL